VRAYATVFFTLLFSYAYFFGGSGFNQNATFALTRAIVERHEIHIDSYAANTADIARRDGHLYSNKAPGLAFAAIVPYAAYHALRGAPEDAHEQNLALYLVTVAVCGVSGACIGVLLFLAARRRGLSSHEAGAIAFVAGLGTPLFAYSTLLFAHVPSALGVLVALLLLDGTLRRNAFLAGAATGAATLVNYTCAPLAVLFAGFLLATSRSRVRESLQYVAGGLPFALLLAWYQAAAFGSPFRTSLALQNPAFRDDSLWLGVLGIPRLAPLWGITFSPYRGLFFLAPVLLVALAGVVLMTRTRRASAWTILLAAAVAILVNAAFNGWHGGYAVGPRYLLHVVPLLALGLVELQGRARVVTRTLAAISLLFNFAVTAVDPQPPDVLKDPIGRYALPALLTGRALHDPAAPWLADFYVGHTSTNRVAADELMPFQKHRPGSSESEWASFNLGELWFGRGSGASVLPWLAVVAAVSLASTRRRRRETRTIPDTQTARSRSA
jgi:hypothetical protein